MVIRMIMLPMIFVYFLQFLKNLKNVFIAKSELLKNLSGRRIAILNGDDEKLKKINVKCLKKILYFGIKSKSDFQATDLFCSRSQWSFRLNGKTPFRIPLLGMHNIYNALAAIAVG